MHLSPEAVWFAALLAIGPSVLIASPAWALWGEEAPLDHWIYPIVDELRLRGIELVGTAGVRPYWLPEIAESLAAHSPGAPGAMSRDGSDDGVARRLLILLRAELADEISLRRGNLPEGGGAALWMEPEGGNYPHDEEKAKGILRGELAGARGRWLSAYLRAKVDTDGSDDLDFLGRSWRGKTTGVIEYSTLCGSGSWWRLVAGRSRTAWGPSRPDGLFLSGSGPSLDGLKIALSGGSFGFQFVAVALDPLWFRRSELGSVASAAEYPEDDTPRPTPRFLTAHRLEWRPRRGLSLGGSEAVLYGGPSRGWELPYLLPFVPYYDEQWNRGRNDNIMVGLDLEWIFRRGSRLHGELLIDDFQYTRHNEPQEIGGVMGLEQVLYGARGAPVFSLDYTRVNTYVYGHGIPWNRYTMGRAVLGDALGPDADRWRLGLVLTPAGGWRVRLEASRIRKGEMTAETPRPTVVPYPGVFPSGVVQKELGGRFVVEWFAPPRAMIRVWLGGETLNGYQHRPGAKRDRLLAGAQLRLGWRHMGGISTGEGQPGAR